MIAETNAQGVLPVAQRALFLVVGAELGSLGERRDLDVCGSCACGDARDGDALAHFLSARGVRPPVRPPLKQQD
jgi:hypothetical protein